MHVAYERCLNDKDWSSALGDGTMRTATDTAIYGPVFGALAYTFGVPAALMIGGLSVAAEFAPMKR